MISLTTAESALKDAYLNAVCNQLNTNANPLLAKIKQTASDVWGKEVRRLAQYGINGGIVQVKKMAIFQKQQVTITNNSF